MQPLPFASLPADVQVYLSGPPGRRLEVAVLVVAEAQLQPGRLAWRHWRGISAFGPSSGACRPGGMCWFEADRLRAELEQLTGKPVLLAIGDEGPGPREEPRKVRSGGAG